ncbi:MAG TPA: hypothetical protein EYQ43_11470 [Methyloprofundus sp.]|nr:hypothetical protein [Methyloprofundus sp.]HIL78033.1 hypothetical protein [Methylococcales bacterium]
MYLKAGMLRSAISGNIFNSCTPFKC